jgi:hypothetical protein
MIHPGPLSRLPGLSCGNEGRKPGRTQGMSHRWPIAPARRPRVKAIVYVHNGTVTRVRSIDPDPSTDSLASP